MISSHGRQLRLFLVLTLLALLPAASSAAEAPHLRTFLDAHCVSCHGGSAKKGSLDLEKLSTDFKEPAAFEAWVKVFDRVQADEMPPRSRKERPDKNDTATVLKELETALADANQARRSGNGRAVFRRLNRTEYENTLRDLLVVPGLKVKNLLPDDGRANGYDKSAAGLDLSYVQLAKYMEAADAALDAAIAPLATRPPLWKAHIPGGGEGLVKTAFVGHTVFIKDFKYDDSVMPVLHERINKEEMAKAMRRDFLKHPYQGSMGVLMAETAEFKPRLPFTVQYPGKYKIRMSVWSFVWDKGEIKPNSRIESAALVADGRTLAYFDAPSMKPTVTEIEVWLDPMTKPHDHIEFNAISLKGPHPHGNLTRFVGSGIAVDWVDIEGPLFEQWPQPGHRRLFGDLPFTPVASAKRKTPAKKKANEPPVDVHYPQRPSQDVFKVHGHEKPFLTNADSIPKLVEFATVKSTAPETDAANLLADFLPRAFRRPVPTEEVSRYVSLVKERLDEGDLFEVAMRTGYKAALCSPDFLFLKEPLGQLDHWAIASRLSYFLWNSMPDAELAGLAEKGRLKDAIVLRGQVERMLKAPKAERFVVDFTDQWLDLRDIDDTTPDKKLYPEFRLMLRDAMLSETRAFLRELLEKDLGASNVVQSDFAMLNQRLAEHYRIPGVTGSAIRRVPLPADSGRGGLLTQASVLKVTANGTVTSPVRRGAWVLNKIIGRPPDPPPPDVPAIEPDVRGTTTIREMLAQHRSNTSCATCHSKIDPPGFALESYDVIGGLQTRYRTLNEEGDMPDKEFTMGRHVPYRWAQKVDASGEMADGRPFAGTEEFRKILLADPRALARNLVRQMVTYSTGAPVEFADRRAVEKILDRTSEGKYGIRSLIHEIVQSPLFLTK